MQTLVASVAERIANQCAVKQRPVELLIMRNDKRINPSHHQSGSDTCMSLLGHNISQELYLLYSADVIQNTFASHIEV